MKLISSHSLLVLFSLCLIEAVVNLAAPDTSDKTAIERCSADREKENGKNSYLWRLEKYPTVYLFGSIHRAYSSVWPMIPRNVKKAFKSSKKIYFEIDLTSSQYLLTIMKCQLLPNKQTLYTVLPPRILEKLRRYLEFVRSQIPSWVRMNGKNGRKKSDKLFKDMTRNWHRKRPIWMLLQLNSLNKNRVRTSGIPSLDFYLFLKARKAGKNIGHVESAEEHCGLNNIDSNQAIAYLNEMLTRYNLARKGKINLVRSADELTYHYLCGNLSNFMFSAKDDGYKSNISELRQQKMREFEESLTEELFVKRNKNMAERIIKEVQSLTSKDSKRIFFTVGAGHLVGNGSIIDILEAKGFKTRHLKKNEKIARLRDPYNRKGRKGIKKEFHPPLLHTTQLSLNAEYKRATQRLSSSYVSSRAVQLGVNLRVWKTATLIILLFKVSIIVI